MTNKPKFITFPFVYEGVTYNSPVELVEKFDMVYEDIMNEYKMQGTIGEKASKSRITKSLRDKAFVKPVVLNGKEYKTLEELDSTFKLNGRSYQTLNPLIRKDKDITEAIQKMMFLHKGKEHLTVETVVPEYNLAMKTVSGCLIDARRKYPDDKETQGLYFESQLASKEYQYTFLEHEGVRYLSTEEYAAVTGVPEYASTVATAMREAKTKEEFQQIVERRIAKAKLRGVEQNK